MNCNIGRVRLTLIGLKEREIEKSEEMELRKWELKERKMWDSVTMKQTYPKSYDKMIIFFLSQKGQPN